MTLDPARYRRSREWKSRQRKSDSGRQEKATLLVALRPVGNHPLKGPGVKCYIQQPLWDFSEGPEDVRGGRNHSGPSLSLQTRKLKPPEGPQSQNVSQAMSPLESHRSNNGIITLIGYDLNNKTLYLGGAPKSVQMVTAAMKLRRLLLGRKATINLDSILKSRDITLPTKVCLVNAMVFPVVMYGCELDYKES